MQGYWDKKKRLENTMKVMKKKAKENAALAYELMKAEKVGV